MPRFDIATIHGFVIPPVLELRSDLQRLGPSSVSFDDSFSLGRVASARYVRRWP
jgi:hypothetical protein